ncbi:MAG: hypothetical protein JSV33_14145, partial [bacterium]
MEQTNSKCSETKCEHFKYCRDNRLRCNWAKKKYNCIKCSLLNRCIELAKAYSRKDGPEASIKAMCLLAYREVTRGEIQQYIEKGGLYGDISDFWPSYYLPVLVPKHIDHNEIKFKNIHVDANTYLCHLS